MSSGLEQMSGTRSPMDVGPTPPRRPDQPPQRGVARYNSGGASRLLPPRRAPPGRSQSHRIGRPTFNAKDGAMPPPPAVPEAVGRNNQRFTRAAPVRSGSFQRSVPNRSSSTSSLKAYRKAHHATPLGKQIEIPGSQMSVDNGDCDSVFTSASNQTLDSIMLRKKQISPNDIGGMAIAARRPRTAAGAGAVGAGGMSIGLNQATFDFDESLHTVDSIGLHMRHVHQVLDEQCDLSVFSESFASTDTYILSDYEDDDDDDKDDDFKDLE